MDVKLSLEGILGVLLAGGCARRMGGCDKPLLPLDDKPILEHVVERAQPQVGKLILSTNSDPSLFHRYPLPVVADTIPGFAGPLAGILAAMEWGQSQPERYRWLASFPTDSPFFPGSLVQRLHAAAQTSGAKIACAISLGQRSPLFALWSMDLCTDLSEQLKNKQRKVGAFLERHPHATVEFAACEDPFFNINTVEQLKTARIMLHKRRAQGDQHESG